MCRQGAGSLITEQVPAAGLPFPKQTPGSDRRSHMIGTHGQECRFKNEAVNRPARAGRVSAAAYCSKCFALAGQELPLGPDSNNLRPSPPGCKVRAWSDPLSCHHDCEFTEHPARMKQCTLPVEPATHFSGPNANKSVKSLVQK